MSGPPVPVLSGHADTGCAPLPLHMPGFQGHLLHGRGSHPQAMNSPWTCRLISNKGCTRPRQSPELQVWGEGCRCVSPNKGAAWISPSHCEEPRSGSKP